MKYCPKCRNFYDDANLAFCQTDGVPLIRLNQSSELWTEGTEAIKTTREITRKQIRIQKLKRFAKILVTTLITTLVIIEIVRNIKFVTPKNEVENVESSSPSPKIKPTINLEISATPKANKIVQKNSTNPNVDNSKSNKCEINQIILSTKDNNYEKWKQLLTNQGTEIKETVSKQNNNIPIDKITVNLNFTKDNIEVTPSSDCLSAMATISYSWKVEANKEFMIVENDIPKEPLSYTCYKNLDWKCE